MSLIQLAENMLETWTRRCTYGKSKKTVWTWLVLIKNPRQHNEYLHIFLKGEVGRTIWPLGVADNASFAVFQLHIESGEEHQHRARQNDADDPYKNGYA